MKIVSFKLLINTFFNKGIYFLFSIFYLLLCVCMYLEGDATHWKNRLNKDLVTLPVYLSDKENILFWFIPPNKSMKTRKYK